MRIPGLFINCVVAGEDKKNPQVLAMPQLDQDAPKPRDAGGIGGLALTALKENECSDPEDHGMGWAGRDLKTTLP